MDISFFWWRVREEAPGQWSVIDEGYQPYYELVADGFASRSKLKIGLFVLSETRACNPCII